MRGSLENASSLQPQTCGRGTVGIWGHLQTDARDFSGPLPEQQVGSHYCSPHDPWPHGSRVNCHQWLEAYDSLATEGYMHLTVNHTYNFVDPNTHAHVNDTENLWWQIKRKLCSTHMQWESWNSHFREFIHVLLPPQGCQPMWTILKGEQKHRQPFFCM